MMSQLSKTIKLALKSTEEERAILRARSAVQRFPVVEWRQRMEDFHKRSINASRHLAGQDAWRQSDGTSVRIAAAVAEHDDWSSVHHVYHPPQPDWDVLSAESTPHSIIPYSPGQWSQETISPSGEPFLHAPPRMQDGTWNSISSMSDTENDPFSQNRGGNGQPEYGNFLDRANRIIAGDQRHGPDPFLEAPFRPFGIHNGSSVESIATIVDEKPNSPLNKAMASVSHTYFSPYHLNL